jgi:DNA-binding transcriptional LysR family regulator
MDPRQLEYFRAAARYEHIGKAAADLGISDSTLSRSIARLEQRYGGELFDRIGRGLRLNGFGRALLQRVERALGELENAEREVRTMRHSGDACITLGFLPSLGVNLIPALITQFERQQREVHFRLRQGSGSLLRDLLLTGEIDLFFGTHRVPDAAMDWRPLWDEELIALVPPMHRYSRRVRLELGEVAQEPLLAMKSGTTIRRMVEDLGRRAGFTPNIVFEGDEVSTLVGLVGAGFGIAIVPEGIAYVRGATVPIRLRDGPRRTIGVSAVRDRFITPSVAAFLNMTVKRAGFGANAPISKRAASAGRRR